MAGPLTGALVDHVLRTEYEAIPPAALAAQKQSLLDILGVMLAATTLGGGAETFTAFAASFGPGRCTLLGAAEKTTPMMAALANGALVHALDFEDSHEKALVHPNSASTPALLALAEHTGGVSGKALLTALALASDICCRLDLGVREDLLKHGWIMPPIHGSMGAVMGAGKLLGLDRAALLDAIGLNLFQATSSAEAANSSTSILRAVREGFAAQAAVQSALLARQGIPAGLEAPFEGKLGYYHMYARGNYDPDRVTAQLGEVYEGAFISFKPWPSCRATHAATEALLGLIAEHDIRPDEIDHIHVVMQEIGRMVFEPAHAKCHPQSAAIAKFSMPFVLATAARCRTVTLEHFSDECLRDAATLALAQKVTCHIEPTWSKAENKRTDLTITTRRGSWTRRTELPLGCVEHPMSDAQRYAKFTDCAARCVKQFSPAHIGAIYDTVLRLEELEDVTELTNLL